MVTNMSVKRTSLRHVSLEQLKAILEFMGQNIEFATGRFRTQEARHISKKLWNDLTVILNTTSSGTQKSADGWSKYWSDFKNKLKNKVTMLKKAKRLDGNSRSQVKPLSKLEKRALVILGPHFERKSGFRSAYNTHNNSNHLSAVVKLEGYQEPQIATNSAFAERELIGRVSEADNESDDNANTTDEDDEESDLNLEEPVINGIYPKWLIAIEEKRAQADYIRAKAEERRAKAAAKNANAALLQSEALQKLAQAAQAQAEAIMKIAMVLENKSNRNGIDIFK